MKKVMAFLLVVILSMGTVACSAPASAPAADAPAADAPAPAAEAVPAAETADVPAGVVEVDYYSNVGGYLETLQGLIDEWNAGEGAEKGVFLNLISNINTYDEDLETLLSSGTYYDIIQASGRKTWVEKGWVQDLREVGAQYPEFQALIDSYEPYINQAHEKSGVLVGLPDETLPVKLAVNTDLLEKNGLEMPKTWADIVECAKVITENGGGKEFGFGWTTWSLNFRRLCFTETINSTERAWWDPNTATYQFSQYKVPMDALREMYTKGYMIGADDLDIDPIREKFAEGLVGFFPAPSYDYGVYTEQFPAKCNWTVIDCPVIEEGQKTYKGVFVDFAGPGICKPAWDAADQTKKDAIVAALTFLNSDYVNQKVYEMGGKLPYKPEVIEAANLPDTMGPQWALFADMTNYVGRFQFPDSELPLEGDSYTTLMTAYMRGEIDDWDGMVADLEARYNQAYADLKASGDTDCSAYEAKWSH